LLFVHLRLTVYSDFVFLVFPGIKSLSNQTSLKEQKEKSKVQKRLRVISEWTKKMIIRAKTYKSRVTRLELTISVFTRICITISNNNDNNNSNNT